MRFAWMLKWSNWRLQDSSFSMTSARALDVVFASVGDPVLGIVRLKALLLDTSGSTATIAIEAEPLLAGFGSQDVIRVGGSSICFIQVPASGLALNRPAAWTGIQTIKPFPVPSEVMSAYDGRAIEMADASSVNLKSRPLRAFLERQFGSNIPTITAVSSSPTLTAPRGLMGQSRAASSAVARPRASGPGELFGDAEEGDEVEGGAPTGAHQHSPGGLPFEAILRRMPEAEEFLREVKMEMIDFLVLTAMHRMNGNGRKVKNRDLEDSSGDDGDGMADRRRGLRQFNNLDRGRKDIQKRPDGMVRGFEQGARRAIGVEPGMPWTFQDLRRIHTWGKHVTLHHRAFEDLAADEMIPTGYTNAKVLWAKTQLIQNYR